MRTFKPNDEVRALRPGKAIGSSVSYNSGDHLVVETATYPVRGLPGMFSVAGEDGWFYVADFELAEDEQLELFPAQPAAPDSNPKTRFGMAKPPLSLIPATALVHMAEGFRDGAAKYGPANWRKDPVSTSTYLNAAYRHIAAWQDGEECDPVSGVHHLGHAADCLAILMDAQACGTLLDDRPPAAPTGDLIRAKTQPLT
ncbi:MAG: dATP/dGTP diphosphohydrolase domain-containing protein [Armatimonadaceae bacterium]